MITTDYTQPESTFQSCTMDQYRIAMYFKDLMQNFMSSVINIHDERLQSLIYRPGDTPEDLSENMIRIGTPYREDSRPAGQTPEIIVGIGNISYINTLLPINAFHQNPVSVVNPSAPIDVTWRTKQISIQISVVAEKYDGALLLMQMLEFFFVKNANSIVDDCKALSSLAVMEISAVQEIQAGGNMNAKQLYQTTMSLAATGHMRWTRDTQGPVFQGVSVNIAN